MNNFIDMVVEDIDNAIMNSDIAREYFDKGGKLFIRIDKDGTEVEEE